MNYGIEWVKNHKVRTAAAICFIILMYVNRVVANESQYIWLITNNFVGPAVTILILSAFPTKDFRKIFYVIWTILGVLGTVGGYLFWYTHQVGHMMYICITVPLNIWFLGAVVIKYIEEILIRRSFSIKFSWWEYTFIACMLLMLFSASNTVWPFYYLVIFLLLWHAPFSDDEKKDVLCGIFDGIIVGFLILQCIAFLNTPYQRPRYRGAYWNCNRNACLYLVAMASLLGKVYMYRLKNKDNHSRAVACYQFVMGCLVSMLVAMIIYSGSRTGIIGAVLIVMLYFFFCEFKLLKEKIRVIVVKLMIYSVVTLVSIPLLYFPIRYFPELKPYVKTVVKNLIRGTDEPFIPVSGLAFDEAIKYNLLRYFEKNDPADSGGNEVISGSVTDSDEISSIEGIDSTGKYYTLNYSYIYYPEKGSFIMRVPRGIYTGMNAIDARINIYAALIDQMNLTGHRDDEVMLEIRSDVPGTYEAYSYNEQNFMIHFLYVYGVPIGIFTCVLVFMDLFFLIKKSISGKLYATIFLMIVSVYFIFGITEIVWVPGQLEQLMLFFVPLFFISDDNKITEVLAERN